MATSTKQARREAEYKRERYYDNYYSLFSMLFDNSVKVVNDTPSVPKRYLLKMLREHGGIAYDKKLGLYLRFVEKGIDVYGLPLEYQLFGANGFTVLRKPEDVVILRANDLKFPLAIYFEEQINKLIDLDMSIEQNLDAIKTMTIAEVPDESCLLSIANEVNARRVGSTIVFKNKNSMEGCELKVSQTGAQYLVDKLLSARREILNETLSTIGISVANVDKKERVQSMEVMASQGYAIDCINTLIDTFNYDAEVGGLPIRLEGNTNLVSQNELELNDMENENE